MSTSSKTYQVNNYKQLIELNGDKTNFDLTFEIKSVDKAPFKALVISENDLNSGNPLNYQDVNGGFINGNVKNDNGVFQTYFLLLKADEPTECEVTISVKDIELNPEIQRRMMLEEQQIQQHQIQQQQIQQQQNKHLQQQQIEQQMIMRRQQEMKEKEQSVKKVGNASTSDIVETLKYWIPIGLGLLVLGLAIWWFFFRNKNKNNTKIQEKSNITVEDVTYTKKVVPLPTLKVSEPERNIPVELPTVSALEPALEPDAEPDMGLGSVVENDGGIEPVSLNTLPKLDNGRRNDGLMKKLNKYFENNS